MKKESYYKADAINQSIYSTESNLNAAKEGKQFALVKEDKPGSFRLILTDVESCGTDAEDVALFKKIKAMVVRHYENKLKSLESDFAKIK